VLPPTGFSPYKHIAQFRLYRLVLQLFSDFLYIIRYNPVLEPFGDKKKEMKIIMVTGEREERIDESGKK